MKKKLLLNSLCSTCLLYLFQLIHKASSWPCLDETETSLQIYNLSQAKKKCKLHKTLRKQLKQQKFKKIMCPFGVLLVATSDYPDEVNNIMIYHVFMSENNQ